MNLKLPTNMFGKIYRAIPAIISLLFIAGTLYTGFYEYKTGKVFTLDLPITSERVFKTPIAFSGGDTWDYILPALQIYEEGKPRFMIEGKSLTFCRRNPTSYLFFVPFWFFGKYMPLVFIIVISLLFGISLYFFYKTLMDIGCNKLLCLLTGLIYLPYWIERIPRLMTEGIVATLIIWGVIIYIRLKEKGFKYIALLFFGLSLIRGEFLILLTLVLIRLIYYWIKDMHMQRKILIDKVLFSLIVAYISLVGWNVYWSKTCGDTSGIWSWSHRSVLIVHKGMSGSKAKDTIMNLYNELIEREWGKGFDVYSYEFFIIHHSYPLYKDRVYLDKSRVLEHLNYDSVRKYILYRVLFRNPYLFIFSQPSSSSILGNFRYVYYLWGLFILASIAILLFYRTHLFLVASYITLLLIYDFYYFVGNMHFPRFKSFYSVFEISIICLSFLLLTFRFSKKKRF